MCDTDVCPLERLPLLEGRFFLERVRPLPRKPPGLAMVSCFCGIAVVAMPQRGGIVQYGCLPVGTPSSFGGAFFLERVRPPPEKTALPGDGELLLRHCRGGNAAEGRDCAIRMFWENDLLFGAFLFIESEADRLIGICAALYSYSGGTA